MNHHPHVHAALGVGLGVKEDFRAHHVVLRRTLQIGHRHVVEVLLMEQHAGTGVVDIQKALQIGESVGAAQCLHAVVLQRHLIARSQSEDELWLQRAFNVHVQFRLGHGAQQLGQACGSNLLHGGGHGVGHKFSKLRR